MKEALLYEQLSNGQVRCHLCAHGCVIDEGKRGLCQVRQNRQGKLHTLVYGHPIARHVDPIEKKPLFHFFPGSKAYSLAAPGCNFRCRWCQNWEISEMPRRQRIVLDQQDGPEDIVDDAEATASWSIAYTYTEPTIFFEYAYDIARLADARGIHNVIVTNGYMTEEMLETFHPYVDAANVDLKSFRDETYRKYVGGRLRPVLDNLKAMQRLGIWVEVTMLIVPGLNDDPAELNEAAQFLAEELGPQTPWHLSRFHPAHRMSDTPPTPVATLELAQRIGRDAGLRYVYMGNLPNEQNTYCHRCKALLVCRSPFGVVEDRVTEKGRCPDCQSPVAGIGMGGAEATRRIGKIENPRPSFPRQSFSSW
jgi:pyruvate formate lyase activating enzyme